MQADRQRVMSGVDFGLDRRMDDTLGKQRPRPGCLGGLVILFNGRDQPDIGIIIERLEVRPAAAFGFLTGDGVDPDRGVGQIDRPELTGKTLPCLAQSMLVPPEAGCPSGRVARLWLHPAPGSGLQ